MTSHSAMILTLSERGQRIRELLYEALVYAGIPQERAAKGAVLLAQVLDGEFDDGD